MRHGIPIMGLIATLFLSFSGMAEEGLTTDKEKLSYTMGYQIGHGIKRQGLDISPEAFAQAIEDILSGAPPKLSMEEMRAVLASQREAATQKRAEVAKKNRQTGEQFLAENKSKEGVKELPSGVQYKIIKKGSGASPEPGDSVVVHYRGTLLEGTEFDSSYKRGEPATFRLDGVIKGFQDALTHMQEGSHWEVYIPSELAYGSKGAGNTIGPNETLIFDIDLLEVKPKSNEQE